MKPLYYHHAPGRLVAVASEPRAILVLPQVPYRLNEGRIADFLVTELEGIDKTSTFFEEVYRLPPAHTLSITPQDMQVRRYWQLESGSELRLPSDEAFAEAFLEVFTEAVRCRLRAVPGTVGSMLSGGMDSSSVVAVARELLAGFDQGPLPTFSAVSPDRATCVETRTIYEALTMHGLEPHCIPHNRLEDLEPDLSDLTWSADEPFDGQMTLIRAIYLAAHRRGIKCMLDGAGGDVVFGEGHYISRLLRQGQWLTAYREAVGQNRFWRGAYPAGQELYQSARLAFIPNRLRKLRRRFRPIDFQHHVDDAVHQSYINPEFARQISLSDRMMLFSQYDYVGLIPDYSRERALSIEHPYLTVGRERYGRIASSVAIDPRDAYLDRRVLDFCLSMPGEQLLAHGWPKAILRRAMTNRLPDAVRLRIGKEHLGWRFTKAFTSRLPEPVDFGSITELSSPYIDVSRLQRAWEESSTDPDPLIYDRMIEVVHLTEWLKRYASRPHKLLKDC